MGYQFHFAVLFQYKGEILHGLLITVYVVCVSLVASWVIGVVVGALGASEHRVGRLIATAYVEAFRIVPELVVIFWIYYCLPIFLDLRMSSFTSGAIALSLISGSTGAEIFRAGFQYVPRGEIEAARSVGLSYFNTFRLVIFPQAVRVMMPSLVNHAIDVLKTSALLSTITVAELMYVAGHINSLTFRPMEIFTLVAFIYFAVSYPMSRLARFWEHREH